MRAVVDRIEGETAVVLVGEGESTIHLPVSELPPGAREGSVLKLWLTVDRQATEEALEQARKRIQRLKELSRGRRPPP